MMEKALNKQKKSWIVFGLSFIVWAFLLTMTVIESYLFFERQGLDIERTYILLRAFLIWGLPVLFIPFYIWLAKSKPIEGSRKRVNGTLHVFVSLLLIPIHAFLFRCITIFRSVAIGIQDDNVWTLEYFFEPYASIITWFIIVSPMVYWVFMGAYYFKRYYEQYRKREQRNLKMKAELTSMQLQVLKIQLHPHFLFNTLHSINTLIHVDPARAQKIMGMLKKFLQMSINKMDRQIIPLRDELEFTELYGEIIEMRFGDRLTIRYNIEQEALDCDVPGLILQPLVENAVKHGISKKIESGIIEIKALRNDGFIELIVEDDGPGLSNSSLNNGMGLDNIQQRLKQLYEEYRMEFSDSELGGFKVLVGIPERADHKQYQNMVPQ